MKPLFSVLPIMFMLALAGCDNENVPSASQSASTTIRGLVSGDHGPVPEATVAAMDQNGHTLASTKAGQDGHYRITIPSGVSYPLILVAKLAKGKELQAVVTNGQVVQQDISPYTDLVVKSARQLGGLTPANIARAAGAAINMRPSQGGERSSVGFKGDLTKQYSGWH